MLVLAVAVTVAIHTAKPVNQFIPAQTFGAGVDGREYGDARRTFTPHNMQSMRSAGFSLLTYRLRTELGVEAWHWNPSGTWSDAAHKQGYWTSNASAGPLPESFGYRLTHRGSTTDQANNDGYSRIDDGDARTYWKSNPYLDEAFTHESNDLHPQWIVVDFVVPTPVNAIRIAWGEPYAIRYEVDYCSSPADFSDQVPQCWAPFPRNAFRVETGFSRSQAKAGPHTDILSDEPIETRYVRILLTESCRCRTSPDIRDRVGFAVRELSVGVMTNGRFRDRIRHSPKHSAQTEIVVSSTDPWHTAADVDRRTEQPSFDRVVASGLTNDRPMLVPVGVLYDTPQNAAAEIAYLLSRGDPITEVEAGEEPDGQYATPEDFGALFLQFADAIHAVAPGVKLGGPCFQTTVSEYFTMPLHGDKRTWMRRFLDYLARRGRIRDYAFFSFEWYPFDNACGDTAPQLAEHAGILRGVLERLQRDGLTRDVPWFMSEYGYSAFANRPEVDIEGALVNAEAVALFLTLGGTRAYLYGFEPNSIMDELSCNSWGNNAMFLLGDDGQAKASTAIYWGTRMIDEEWVQPGNATHQIFAAEASETLVGAYAVLRPDRQWSVLLINKDPLRQYEVTLDPQPGGDVEVIRYSREQYRWKPDGERGHPVKNDPPERRRISAADPVIIPPYSLTVVRYHPRQ